jgi:hypothetical protein
MTNAELLEGSLRRALAFAHAALEAGQPDGARGAVIAALHELAHAGPLWLTMERAHQITPLVLRLREVLAALAVTAGDHAA